MNRLTSSAPGRRLAASWLFLALLATTGCAQRYAMTLSNSDVIYTSTKPQLNDRGVYEFKDSAGRPQQINALRVRQIERR